MKVISTLACLAAVGAVSLRHADAPGFRVEVHSFGETPAAGTCKDGDKAAVNYVGKLPDGRIFDQSTKDEVLNPLEFTIGAGQVIKCWDMALAQMRVGEKATVTCPPEIAYGQQAPGGIIPPNATLIFDIDVAGCDTQY